VAQERSGVPFAHRGRASARAVAAQRLQGMVHDRKCRDVLFLLFFTAFWAGMFYVCGIAFEKGGQRQGRGAMHVPG